MADDLSVNMASSMMQMLASKTSTELGMKLMKMRAQPQQAMVAMLADQTSFLKHAGYNSSGGSVPPVNQTAVDAAL
jgi:hypothetical protein